MRQGEGPALRILSCSHTAYFSCGESVVEPSFARLRVSVKLVTLRVANTFALRPARGSVYEEQSDLIYVLRAGGSYGERTWQLAGKRGGVCNSLDAVKVLCDPEM